MTQVQRINIKKLFVISVIVGVFLCSMAYLVGNLLLMSYLRLRQASREPVVHKVLQSDAVFEELWVQSNLIERWHFFDMAAAQETIFLLGKSSTFREVGTVFAFDASDGKTVLWQDNGPSYNGQRRMYATSEALYVGTLGTPYITAYDLRTGEMLWSQRLRPAERAVDSIYVLNDKIFTSAQNYEFILQADTGEILGTFDLKNPLPSEFKLEYLYNPILTENVSFVWDPGYRLVKAIDRQTDHELWEVTNAASNPAATEQAVYLLTTEGTLLALDPQNGDVLASLQFDAPSFGHIAIDQDIGLLYVYLYDSEQLFAFRIVDYSPN